MYHEGHMFANILTEIIVWNSQSTDQYLKILLTGWSHVRRHAPELSKSLSCLSHNRSGRCGQCVRPIKHLPDLHIFYNFNRITHILAKSIKWFVYSFKWYLGILKVSTTHFCVTCADVEIYIRGWKFCWAGPSPGLFELS